MEFLGSCRVDFLLLCSVILNYCRGDGAKIPYAIFQIRHDWGGRGLDFFKKEKGKQDFMSHLTMNLFSSA